MNLYLAESGGVMRAYLKGVDDVDVYMAGGDGEMKKFTRKEQGGHDGSIFKDANILQSFYYADDFTSNVIIPNCKNFLLDSGAFTFMQQKKKEHVNWDEYVERYADFIVRNNVERYFELDIDSVVGYEAVKAIRNRLETLTGRQSIPVWHYERGKDEWLRLCDEYGYVAIGGLVSGGGEYAKKHRRYFPWFIQTAHERGAKVHALGFTALADLGKYHFDSVDSTAWVSGNRFGAVYVFNGTTLERHTRKEGQRIRSHKELAIHNFKEWKKFQQYAEVNL